MISESLYAEQRVVDQVKENKSFGFIKLYKSTAETKVPFETTERSKKVKKLNKSSQPELDTSKCSRSPNKSKKKKSNETLDLSNIETAEHSSSKTRSAKKYVSSTPNNKGEHLNNGVKSIMKNKSSDSVLNVSNVSTPTSKPKKRNKSVSFMLEDGEEVVVKKCKSNDLSKERINGDRELRNKEKSGNSKTNKQKKKGNQNLNGNIKMVKDKVGEPIEDVQVADNLGSEVTVKIKKGKKSKPESEKHVEISETNVAEEQSLENKSRKLKKKKRKAKSLQDDSIDTGDEPAVKTRKKDFKPEAIAKGLENLNIGDNAHTLTNLLDEMTVVDKNKKKKDRQKLKSKKQKKTDKQELVPPQTNNTEEKERVKWNNRKWNKEAKGEGRPRLHTSVVVENLPINIMCSYKKLLSEHFNKFGTIAGIGVAEAYPTEDLNPVFTTTVFFQEEEAATKALEEDNTLYEGSRIRVRRPQPPTETTLVVRGYALSDQALSSMFSSAGRVRSIRQLVKGKKSMPTAFVEFDGSEAVERALKMAEDAKINGKKMYVSKFEIRKKRKSDKNLANGGDNGASAE